MWRNYEPSINTWMLDNVTLSFEVINEYFMLKNSLNRNFYATTLWFLALVTTNPKSFSWAALMLTKHWIFIRIIIHQRPKKEEFLCRCFDWSLHVRWISVNCSRTQLTLSRSKFIIWVISLRRKNDFIVKLYGNYIHTYSDFWKVPFQFNRKAIWTIEGLQIFWVW